MGIMAGFAVLGLTFYVIVVGGQAQVSALVTSVSYVALAAASITAVWLLKNGRRIGAYLAFAILSISVLAPVQSSSGGFTIIYWFAIPNAAVGILLLKTIKTLR
jgi:hypothetical protein